MNKTNLNGKKILFHAFSLIVAVVSLTRPAFGASDNRQYFVGFGGFAENMKKYSNDAAADTTSTFGSSYMNLLFSAFFPVSPNLYFSPAVTYTPFGVKSPDSGETSRLLTLQFRGEYRLDPFNFRIGPGLFHKSISASGGTITLNNGVSTTVFGFPPQSSSMNLIDWDIGTGYAFSSFRFDLDFLITDIATSRRAVNGMATVSYGLF